MQAKAEVARLKEMLAEKGIDPSLTPGENNTAAVASPTSSENVDSDVNPSEKCRVPVPPSESVTQRPNVRSIKNEYGEEVVEHDLKGKKK